VIREERRNLLFSSGKEEKKIPFEYQQRRTTTVAEHLTNTEKNRRTRLSGHLTYRCTGEIDMVVFRRDDRRTQSCWRRRRRRHTAKSPARNPGGPNT